MTKHDIHVTFMQFHAVCVSIRIDLSRVEFGSFQEFQIFIKHQYSLFGILTYINTGVV